MMKLTKEDKMELSRMLESIRGRLDDKLSKLVLDLIFQNRIRPRKEDEHLLSVNIKKIPKEPLDAFSVGSFFGQTYQISLDLAKKMELKLDSNQKRILREFTLFLVLFKFEKEPS